jgi:HK97 family phage portal protein
MSIIDKALGVVGLARKSDPTWGANSPWATSSAAWSARNYATFAENGYQKNVIARRCITIVAQNVAKVPLCLKSGKKEVDDRNHPLLKLLHRPNPTTAGAAFIEAVVAYRMLGGNSMVAGVQPTLNKGAIVPNDMPFTELWPIRPDRFTVTKGQFGVSSYTYRGSSGEVVWLTDPINGRANLLHWKTFNPFDPVWGMSPSESAAWSIDQHNATGRWNFNLLKNGARPSGGFGFPKDSTTKTLTPEQRERMKKEIDDTLSGPENAGRPMLLEGGLQWQEMSFSPKDMDWIESKNTSARDIALAFGVPSQILGIPGDNTYANMAEARMGLYDETVLPTLDALLDEFNAWLVPRYGDDLCLHYDADAIEALEPRRASKWQAVSQNNCLTINEKRAALGYEEIDDEMADTVLVQSSLIPLEDLASVEDPNADPANPDDPNADPQADPAAKDPEAGDDAADQGGSSEGDQNQSKASIRELKKVNDLTRRLLTIGKRRK